VHLLKKLKNGGMKMFTAEMFEPVITAVTAVVPVAIGAGVGVFSVTWVAKKGFGLVKSMMNKG